MNHGRCLPRRSCMSDSSFGQGMAPRWLTVEEKGRKPWRGFRECEDKGVTFVNGESTILDSGLDAGNGLVSEIRPKRPFCMQCRKPGSLCICGRIKSVVDNQVGVTILQHPEERYHALGSARIACLSLQNVQLITVPEVDENVTYRIRPKVPGSKRSIAGRGGKKMQAMQSKKGARSKVLAPPFPSPFAASVMPEGRSGDADVHLDPVLVPSWISLPEGTGLLFPSDTAVELLPVSLGHVDTFAPPQHGDSVRAINHLVVLDGTWSKAKRMYCENTWLQALPHFRLSTTAPSMSHCVRKQPKAGCLSTIESIVFALKVLEPETSGLDTLLEVFDSMIEDQKRCKAENSQK